MPGFQDNLSKKLSGLIACPMRPCCDALSQMLLFPFYRKG